MLLLSSPLFSNVSYLMLPTGQTYSTSWLQVLPALRPNDPHDGRKDSANVLAPHLESLRKIYLQELHCPTTYMSINISSPLSPSDLTANQRKIENREQYPPEETEHLSYPSCTVISYTNSPSLNKGEHF